MSYSTILSILGVSVSVLFGTWGIILAIRNRYPGRITYVKEQTIELFDSIGKNLPELAVTYKKQQIKQNLVLINGAFLNTGKIDISPTMTEDPITLSLPEEFKWLTAKVVSTSEKVNADINLKDENNIILTPSLFRCGEYIRIQALAEVPIPENSENNSKKVKMGSHLEEALTFSHRIMNTRKIDQRRIYEQDVYKRRKRFSLIMLAGIVTLIFVFGVIFFIKGVPSQLTYNYKAKNGNSYVVTIEPRDNNKVKVKDLEGKFEIETNLNDCFANVTGNPNLTTRKDIFKPLYILATAYIGIPLLLLLIIVIANRRNAKLIKILEL